jgi:hypothetical protein
MPIFFVEKTFNSFIAKTIWEKNECENATCTLYFEKKLTNNIYIYRYIIQPHIYYR